MAWRCHGTDNNSLVRKLQENEIVQSEEVATAMLAVDRGRYVDDHPYEDAPQRIGFNITISAPHMHAHALELLKNTLRPGCRALDIGSGSEMRKNGFFSKFFLQSCKDEVERI